MVERLSGSSENTKPAKLDDKTITDMVESFEVANERMSAVRYLADYTFHFRPSKVRRVVRIADSPAAEGDRRPAVSEPSAKPVVVLPVYKDAGRAVLWDDPNPWREAWAQRSRESRVVHLMIPLGDASDVTAIDANLAESGKSEALAAIAQRNGGDETVVALATARRQADKLVGLEVSIKWYRAGRLADAQTSSVETRAEESEGDFLKRAAEIAAGIASSPRKNPSQGVLAASVPLNNLGEWVLVRERLASAAAVRKIDLLSLSRQEAKIQIRYVGSADQLKSSLAEVDLGLGGGDPVWVLQVPGTVSSR